MKQGLNNKIVCLTLAVLLLTVVVNLLVSTAVFRNSYSSALQSELYVTCLHLKSQVDHVVRSGTPVQDIAGFERQCGEVVAEHPDVAYALVARTDGQILFHQDASAMGRRIEDADLLRGLARGTKVLCTSAYRGQACYTMILPIEGGDAAAVVGVPMALVTGKARGLMTDGLGIGLASASVALILLAIGWSMAVTRPLSKLLSTIQQIGASADLNRRVDIQSADELGLLASAFNRMTEDLQRTMTSIDNLQREVEQRTRAEQRQAELVARLEATNKELSSFAYVVSHDLKAPLRGIQTIADWLQVDYADKLDEEGRTQLRLLSQRTLRMKNLIDGILSYSRAGRVDEVCTSVDLNALLPQVLDLLAVPKHIRVTLDQTMPCILAEPTRIAQVFQNLLSNAIKYMDKEEGDVHIQCVEEADAWTFSVSDNGPGIEEKYFDKIFGLFQTLAPRDQFESTGVGLAVVKKHVEMAGGRIWVTSEVGKGTTFHFTVPKAPQAPVAAEVTEAAAR